MRRCLRLTNSLRVRGEGAIVMHWRAVRQASGGSHLSRRVRATVAYGGLVFSTCACSPRSPTNVHFVVPTGFKGFIVIQLDQSSKYTPASTGGKVVLTI